MDLRGFLLALTESWVSLMGGIASVILSFVGAFYSWQGKSTPARSLWIAALICFFIAAVRIWTVEHRKYLEECAKNDTVFTLSIIPGSYWVYDVDHDQTHIFAMLRIINKGASSPAIYWRAHYKSSTLDQQAKLYEPQYGQMDMHQENGQTLRITSDDLISNRSITPIERRGMLNGRLWINVPGNKTAEMAEGNATITIMCCDYADRPYECKFTPLGGGTFVHQPGIRKPVVR
jgi:hypothetical protein